MPHKNDAGETIYCPNCDSDHLIRAGVFRKKQRYRCKECGTHVTPKPTMRTRAQLSREKAAQLLYMAGLHNEEIQEIFGASYYHVRKWIAPIQAIVDADEEMQSIRRPEEVTFESVKTGTAIKPSKGQTGIFIELEEDPLNGKAVIVRSV